MHDHKHAATFCCISSNNNNSPVCMRRFNTPPSVARKLDTNPDNAPDDGSKESNKLGAERATTHAHRDSISSSSRSVSGPKEMYAPIFHYLEKGADRQRRDERDGSLDSKAMNARINELEDTLRASEVCAECACCVCADCAKCVCSVLSA